MTDLIVHIGMPKCASSTLQTEVLKDVPGYLGTWSKIPRNKNYSAEFLKLSSAGPRLWGSIRAARLWADRVKLAQQSLNPDIRRYILSQETLANRNLLHPRPIVPFLKRFQDEVWKDGKIKVILVLRNQADRLASEYAQTSAISLEASQEHFERHIKRILRSDLGRLDYAPWVEDLHRNIGRDNVLVLLMEEIGSPFFWEQFAGFIDLENFDYQKYVGGSGRNNRRVSTSEWALQPLDLGRKSRAEVGRIVGLVWPAGLGSSARDFLTRGAEFALSRIYGWLVTVSRPTSRGDTIVLTDDLRDQIKEVCNPMNRKLSELLEMDLGKLGY